MLKDTLRDLRKQNELTQQQVADVLSIDRSTYAYYETGKTSPDVQQLLQLAQIFKVTPNAMLGFKVPAPSALVLRDRSPFVTKKDPKPLSILELDEKEKKILYLYRLLDEESKEETIKQMHEKIKTGN